MTDGGSNAVITGITAADDNHIFPLGLHIFFIFKIRIQKAPGIGFQKIHRKIDSLGISARSIDVSGIRGTACQYDAVKIMQKLGCFDVLADVGSCDKGDTLFLHNIDLAVNDLFFQFHVGDAVHQQSSHTIGTLEYCYLMSSLVQQIRCCQSGRTAADDCYLFTGAYHRGLGCRIALAVGVFNDGIFVLLGGDRIPVQSAGTCCLTQGRTHSGSELGEIVGLLQTVVSLLPVAGIYQIVPLRHQIVQGASAGHTADHHARLTERHTAFHTSGTL